jgi:hypothetical protein
MKIKIGDLVKCRDSSLKNYIIGGSWYGKTLEVAKIYKNEILLHTEDKLDYYVCLPTDIVGFN